MRAALSLSLLLAVSQSVLAKISYEKGDTTYPYAVCTPKGGVSSSKPLPAMIFTHGSGSSGECSDVGENVFWDGAGSLCRDYNSGSSSAAASKMGDNFIVLLPLCCTSSCFGSQRQWDPKALLSVVKDAQSKYPIDDDKIHLGGYSMGGKATWMEALTSPTTFASLTADAGFNQINSTINSLTSQHLAVIVDNDIAVQGFRGSRDDKQPSSSATPVFQKLAALGSDAELTVLSGDHQAMSTAPWKLVSTWEWILKQSRANKVSPSTKRMRRALRL